jgi:ribonuclease J
MKVVETVTAGGIMVDGLGVGDVGNVVLRDRKHLAEDGIIVAALSVDSVTREVLSGPELISRGFVYVKEAEKLLADANNVACDILEQCYIQNIRDWNNIKNRLRDGVSRYFMETTGRSPMIIPIIMIAD